MPGEGKTRALAGSDIETLSRADLEAEVRRLQARLAESGPDAEGGQASGLAGREQVTGEDWHALTRAPPLGSEQYRALFEALDDGFCIIEFFDGPHGPLSDYVHVEANPGYARHTGIARIVGQTVRAMAPAEADGWVSIYGSVLRTGEPVRFERDFVMTGRRIEVAAHRIEPAERRQVAVIFRNLTEQARTRERFKLAIAATRVGIFDLDLTTGELEWDARVRELFGVEPDVTITYEGTFLPSLHPCDRDRADAAVRAAIDPGGSGIFDIEYRVCPPGGEQRWLAARGQAVVIGDRTLRFVGTVRDITAAKTAEEALRATEERYRMAARATSDAIWDWDLARDHVLWNEALETVHGHTPSAVEPTGGWWLAQIHPDDRARISESIHAVIDTDGVIWTDEYRFRQASGAYATIVDRGYVIRDETGRAVRMIGAMLDLTQRHETEERLRASEAIARENADRVQLALSAGAIIGTWNWDLPSDRFTVDKAFAHSFGLDPALGREGLSLAQVVETVHPEDRAGLAAAIEEAVARGGAYAHQYRVRRADGRYYWLEANGRVDHGADGTPLSFPGVLIDVDGRRAVAAERDRALQMLRGLTETLEQRVAERTTELMKTEEALRQSQKMEAVGQLTGGLAHDFNNLLAGISGSLELMQTRISQGRLKDVDRYLTAAQGASRRAAALTHRLLAFSRRQTLDPRPTDVNGLVGGMEDLIRRTVGPAVEIEVVGTAGLWPTLVDPPQLENALLNLCINARDAMPEGGRITIETANKWLDDVAARRHDIPPGQYLALCVTDTGTGMTPDVIAKAFEPFFTTKPIGAGTGLGLSMIYGFAQQSGGQVRIYSEVGTGTTVCIYLPRHYGEAEAPDPLAALIDAPRAEQGETVLVVDDEPTVRMLVTEVLEDLGYTAIEAADSASGLKVLQSDVHLDLLITDVGLPGGMNGRQMADAARLKRPDLKVLFITGYAENAVVGNGHLEPGMAVLTKPFVVENLGLRIREIIGRC